jgi:hypothetical protein
MGRLIGDLGRVGAIALLAGSLGTAARAGPPFVTDDPQPTDLGHWEIYNFVSGVAIQAGGSGQAGLDINYGGAKDLQLTAVIPLNAQSGAAVGLGDIQLAAKYRFLHQTADGWVPDVSVFPRLFTPTAARQFGPQRLSLLVPIWAEKDLGPWSVFGGGGYDINPGPDNRNFWQGGLALTRAVSNRLTLGGEIYAQTAADRDSKPFTGLNAGVLYKLSDHWSLLAAGGPGVQNARQEGLYDVYVALEATY